MNTPKPKVLLTVLGPLDIAQMLLLDHMFPGAAIRQASSVMVDGVARAVFEILEEEKEWPKLP